MGYLAECLTPFRTKVQEEISDLENQVRPLLNKLEEARRKLRAVDELLNSASGSGPSETRNGRSALVVTPVSEEIGGARGAFTPTSAYWEPILESLVELGGSARADDVIGRVGRKMEKILKPADYEMLPSGGQVRWQNRAAWQRLNMVKQRLLRADTPRGIWEITPEGREWLGRQGR